MTPPIGFCKSAESILAILNTNALLRWTPYGDASAVSPPFERGADTTNDNEWPNLLVITEFYGHDGVAKVLKAGGRRTTNFELRPVLRSESMFDLRYRNNFYICVASSLPSGNGSIEVSVAEPALRISDRSKSVG